MENFPIQN